jgi:hypothetical protein
LRCEECKCSIFLLGACMVYYLFLSCTVMISWQGCKEGFELRPESCLQTFFFSLLPCSSNLTRMWYCYWTLWLLYYICNKVESSQASYGSYCCWNRLVCTIYIQRLKMLQWFLELFSWTLLTSFYTQIFFFYGKPIFIDLLFSWVVSLLWPV